MDNTRTSSTEKRLLFDAARRYQWALALAILTAICHFIYGVWFWTKSPTNAPKTGLHLSGEDYLNTYKPSGWGTKNEMDGSLYNRGAIEVLKTGVPRTFSGALHLHSPVYPYFLAACYKIGGTRLLSVAVPQAILSGLTAFLIALAAFRLAPANKMIALLAGGCLLLINHQVAVFVANPVPVNLLLCIFAAAVLSLSGTSDPKGGLLGGVVLLAVGIYTQAFFFAVAVPAGVWLLLQWWKERAPRFLLGAGVLLVLALAKVGLGYYLKDDHADDYIRFAARGLLWQNNNPRYENLQWWNVWQTRLVVTPDMGVSEEQKQRFTSYLERADGDWQHASILWVRENPGHYLKLCFIRFHTFWGPINGDMKRINRILSTGLWLLIYPAGLWAMWKWRHWPFTQLAWLMGAGMMLLNVVVLLSFRYRQPLDLLLTTYAAMFYAELWARLRRQQ
jgi:4-amino-4-deoxy-L-arabinose transferase-like glycosyltransferase